MRDARWLHEYLRGTRPLKLSTLTQLVCETLADTTSSVFETHQPIVCETLADVTTFLRETSAGPIFKGQTAK